MSERPIVSPNVTIRDVAEAAGVSISLVSFVLNAPRGPGGEYLCSASQKTAERIVETAERLGYNRNKAATSLRTGRTDTIGVIVSDISNTCFGQICRKIEKLATEAGYLTIFASTDDRKENFRQLVDKFLYSGVDGFIVAPCHGVEDSIAKILKRRLPVVLFDRDLPGMEGVGRVLLDNEKAGRVAVRILRNQGCRHIGLVRYETDIPTIIAREKGCRLEAQESGIPFTSAILARETMRRDMVSVLHNAREEGIDATYPAVFDENEKNDPSKFECYRFEINMPDGRPSRGYLAYPKGADLKSLPIFVWLHGAGVIKRGNRALASRVLAEASKGCIAMDINAHGFEDDQPQEYYSELDAGELRAYSSRDFSGKGDYYFHNMYLRDVRALDYATTLPYWDGKRIIVYGGSQGGGQALALAGIDHRVTHCVAIVPALTDMGGVLDGRKCGWPSSPNKKNAQTYLGPGVMAYHDGALLVSLFKGDLYIEAGNIDVTCDPACVAAAYNNAVNVKSKQILFFPRRPHGDANLIKDQAWNEQVLEKRQAFIKEALIPPSLQCSCPE